MDGEVDPDELEKTRGRAKELRSKSDFLGAKKLYRQVISKERDAQKLFEDLLQFCVCSMMNDPLSTDFFIPFNDRVSKLKVNLKDKEGGYVNGEFFVEQLIILSSACIQICHKNNFIRFKKEKESEVAYQIEKSTRQEITDCLDKMSDLFIQMLGLIQFRWTICRAFVPLTEKIMTFLDNLPSPSSKTLLKIECCINIGSFWFELGDFLQSEQSFSKGLEIWHAQFGTHSTGSPPLKLYEKYAYFSQAIKLEGDHNMLENFLRKAGKEERKTIQSLGKQFKSPLSHSRQIVKLKKMEGEFWKQLQKKKYSKANKIAAKIGEDGQNHILSFQSALMTSECELKEKRVLGEHFDNFLVLLKKLQLTSKLILNLSDERMNVNQICQSVILLQAAVRLDPEDVIVIELSTKRLVQVCESSPISTDVLELVTSLAVTWAPEAFQMARDGKNQIRKQLSAIGQIYSDIATAFYIFNDLENLKDFSKQGVNFYSREKEIQKSLAYSSLLYYKAITEYRSRKFSTACVTVKAAKESIQNAPGDQMSKHILEQEIDKLQENLEHQAERSLSASSSFATLPGFKNRRDTSITSMPDVFTDSGSKSDEERRRGAVPVASRRNQSALEKIESLLTDAEQSYSNIIEKVLPAMQEAWNEIALPEGNISTEVKESCLHNICLVHLMVGNFEQALTAANEGLSGDNLYGITYVKLLIIAGDASSKLGDISEAGVFYSRAHDHIKQIGSTTETNELQTQILRKISEGKIGRTSRSGLLTVTKLIGPEGGKIEICEWTIYFSKDSLKELTLVNITLESGESDTPQNVIPIASCLKLYPKMDLNKAAKVKVKTWCSTSCPDTKAEIYYKDSSAKDWRWIKQADIGHGREIEFEIDKFCGYAPTIKEGSEVDFHVKSWLFANVLRGILCNRIFADSEANEAGLAKCMELHGYEPSHFPVEVVTAKNDFLEMSLENVDGQHPRYTIQPPLRRVKVSADIIRKPVDRNELDFVVKEYDGKKIILNHILKQERGGRVVLRKEKDVILSFPLQHGTHVHGPVETVLL